MEKYILDTSLFFNMEAGFSLGKNTNKVITNLINYAEKLKGKIDFLMPPGVVEEFLSFFEDKKQERIKKLLSLIIIKSPDTNKIELPAAIFYRLIADVRKRNYQGLNLGEEEINKAGRLMQGLENLSKKDYEIKIGTIIKNFRSRYRQATRTGFLDSVTDLDLIILTKEVEGFLISADEGVISWGRFFGVKEVRPPSFRPRLESLLDRRG